VRIEFQSFIKSFSFICISPVYVAIDNLKMGVGQIYAQSILAQEYSDEYLCV